MIKELSDEVMDKIVELTGATAIFILISDAQIPCPDVRAGHGCGGGHRVFAGAKNLDPLAIPQFISDITGVTEFNIEPYDGDIPRGS